MSKRHARTGGKLLIRFLAGVLGSQDLRAGARSEQTYSGLWGAMVVRGSVVGGWSHFDAVLLGK